MNIQTTDYIYAEPEPCEAFMDQKGGLHSSRETAIAANIEQDVRRAMDSIYKPDDNPLQFMRLIDRLASKHPQMLRDFIDSRN